ncbi:MAG: hypothetical protein HY909_22230 [Deltaproteobacteria bacterium]|nr:hypothetical protein [Deltaproteobacteria bacterium]
MADLPGITEAVLRDHVGAASFERALDYVREGRVFDARRQGSTLRARCEGSDETSYQVRATLDRGLVSQSGCTCPVGGDGRCKHVGALLLTWRLRPGDFIEVDDADTALRRRTRAELIAVIKQMLRQAPDLETLLITPLPTSHGRTPPGPTSARLYRRQADAVFRRCGEEWGAVVPIAEELRALLAIGQGFAEADDPAAATAVFEGVAEAVYDRYEDYVRQDVDGRLRAVARSAVAGLWRALNLRPDDPTREAILRVLLEIYVADTDYGDTGPADDAASLLVLQTRPEEKRALASRLRAMAPGATTWRAQRHPDLLLDLEADALSDEAYLDACRELGRHRDRVERLLERGRPQEAIDAAEEAEGMAFVAAVQSLVGHCHEAAAEELVRRRVEGSADPVLLAFLRDRHQARGERSAALDLTVRLFELVPTLPRYREARELARAVGTWDALRPRLMTAAQARRLPGLLAELHLDEGAIDEALAVVSTEKTLDPGGRPLRLGMKLPVARQAESTRPLAAAEIYLQHAEDLVGTGTREAYREACSWLQKARELQTRAGRPDAWSAFREAFGQRHGRLRALREELAAAGV